MKVHIAIMKKYLKDLWREKTAVLFFALILFIAISLSLLIITATFVYNPQLLSTERLQVGVIDGYEYPAAFGSRTNTTRFATYDDALLAFDEGKIDAILYQVQAYNQTDVAIIELTVPSSPVTQSIVYATLIPYFERIESNLQLTRDFPNYVWHTQISSRGQFLKGTDVIYELALQFIIPLFLLIPAFIIGNLFIDSISQEIEQKTNAVLFSHISKRVYYEAYVLLGIIASIIISTILLGILALRFTFIQNSVLILTYIALFSMCTIIISICLVLSFPNKEISQTVYAFGVLAMFLLSPFLAFSPLQTISRLAIGDFSAVIASFSIVLLCILISMCIFMRKVAQE